MKLVLPIGGKSSRYGLSRPKWMLTLPSGMLMIEESISGIDLSLFDEVVIIAARDYFLQFISVETLTALIEDRYHIPVRIILLDSMTQDQPQTVYEGLKKLNNSSFPFLVKDCDNRFSCTVSPKNSVFYLDLNNIDFVNARNKSYIKFNSLGVIDSIIEKKVISNSFCVGGYVFSSSADFMKSYEEIRSSITNMYLSHLIFHEIASGKIYHAQEVQNYIDWGTINEYRDYQSSFGTFFLDFDGVLVKNSSKFATSPWAYEPISENLSFISNHLEKHPYSCVVITTSRPSSEKQNIIKFLAEFGIQVHSVITDLPHAQRILVNDFSLSNSYPSAHALSVPRNCDNLSDYFAKIFS